MDDQDHLDKSDDLELLSDVSETEHAATDEKNEKNQEQLNSIMLIPTEMPDHAYAAAVKEKLRARATPYEAKQQ
eukprot:11893211-Prorocentrum_lima.AAC.1